MAECVEKEKIQTVFEKGFSKKVFLIIKRTSVSSGFFFHGFLEKREGKKRTETWKPFGQPDGHTGKDLLVKGFHGLPPQKSRAKGSFSSVAGSRRSR